MAAEAGTLSLWLLYTSTFHAAHLAAWGVLLSAWRTGAFPLVGGIVIWALAHLPWGALEGQVGSAARIASAFLPATGASPGLASPLAAAGLLLLALAAARPVEGRG